MDLSPSTIGSYLNSIILSIYEPFWSFYMWDQDLAFSTAKSTFATTL
jgi:hypothetical protein